MPKNLETLKKNIEEHKDELREKFGVVYIGIFGSYAKDQQEEKSDLDVVVEFDPKAEISLLDFIKLKDFLSNLLGVEVDLVEKKTIHKSLKKTIEKEVIPI